MEQLSCGRLLIGQSAMTFDVAHTLITAILYRTGAATGELAVWRDIESDFQGPVTVQANVGWPTLSPLIVGLPTLKNPAVLPTTDPDP